MLTPDQSRIWEAMDIGPQWILRESLDPLLPETALQKPVEPVSAVRRDKAPSAEPVTSFTPRKEEGRSRAVLRKESSLAVSHREEKPHHEAPVLHLDPAIASAIPTADWETLGKLALSCQCCSMAKTRQHVVFAEGGPGVRAVLVGEAPGGEEDLQGVPFVGKSGQLLTQMLESIGVERGKDIAIMNVLKCRPPQNRNPAPQEIACCEAFLRRQLELVRPDVILIMGRFAFQTLLDVPPQTTVGSKRGIIHDIEYAPGLRAKAVVTYHPSYLLRSPEQKIKSWEDLLLFKKALKDAGISIKERQKQWE